LLFSSRPREADIDNCELSTPGRLDEVPSIAVNVLKRCHGAIRLQPRLLDELDAPSEIGRVIAGEVVRLKKQKDSAAALVTDCLALAVPDSTCKQKTARIPGWAYYDPALFCR